MVKKTAGKKEKKAKEEEGGGVSLDDAFGDDDGVEYAEDRRQVSQHPASIKLRKENKAKKGEGMSEEELEEEIEAIEAEHEQGDGTREPVTIQASKPIGAIKKDDRIQIDGKEYIVDAHEVLIDHGNTKEMAIELYDADDGDYQLRYFDDQVETTLELYELQEIMYMKKQIRSVRW